MSCPKESTCTDVECILGHDDVYHRWIDLNSLAREELRKAELEIEHGIQPVYPDEECDDNCSDIMCQKSHPYSKARRLVKLNAICIFKVNLTSCRFIYGDCSICQNTGSDVRSLVCGHAFHGSCISEWLTRKESCPVCRHDLYPGSFKQSYSCYHH